MVYIIMLKRIDWQCFGIRLSKFYETNLFEASEPDLMSDDTPNCVNDSNFSNYQWNLRNTGQNGGTIGVDVNFCNARSITTGSQNVIVAIVDQGIQLDHPDLNVHSISYDTESGTSPSRVLGTHGTNCAGFISAKQIIVLVSHPSLQIAVNVN